MLNPRLVRLSDTGIDRSLRQRPIRQPPLAPDNLALAVGYVIFRVRRRAGLSQRQLAIRLDLSPSAVSRWEAGLRSPTLSHLVLLGELDGRPGSSLLIEAEVLLRLARRDGGNPDGSDPDRRGGGFDHAADD